MKIFENIINYFNINHFPFLSILINVFRKVDNEYFLVKTWLIISNLSDVYFSRKKGKPTATRTSAIMYFSQKIKRIIKKPQHY